MAKENFDPLWKFFLFPALGFVVDIVMICVYGFPAVFWGLVALATLVAGCWWIYSNFEDSGDQDSTLPMVATTVIPLVSMILGYAL